MNEIKKGEEKLAQTESPEEIKEHGEDVSLAKEFVELKRQLQEKEREAKDTLDRLLRVRADFDNYQKRAKKEKKEFEKFASEGMIRELLPVMDNLERAMNSTNGSILSQPKEIGEIAPLVKGLEMTMKQFKDILKNAGLTEIKSIGESFDPSRHEAIKLISSHEDADNTIVEEYEKGYLLHDRVIRPSKVGVAKNKVSENQSVKESKFKNPVSKIQTLIL